MGDGGAVFVDEAADVADGLVGPEGADGGAEVSEAVDAVVVLGVGDDGVAVGAEEVAFGGEDLVFAAVLLVVVVDEEDGHGGWVW